MNVDNIDKQLLAKALPILNEKGGTLEDYLNYSLRILIDQNENKD